MCTQEGVPRKILECITNRSTPRSIVDQYCSMQMDGVATLSDQCLFYLFNLTPWILFHGIRHWDQLPFAIHPCTRRKLTLLIHQIRHCKYDLADAVNRREPLYILDEDGNVSKFNTMVPPIGTLHISLMSPEYVRFLSDMFPHLTALTVAYFDFPLATLHHTIDLLEQWGPKLVHFALYGGFSEFDIPLSNRLLTAINSMHSLRQLKLRLNNIGAVVPAGEEGFEVELPILERLEWFEYEYRKHAYHQFYDSLKRFGDTNANLQCVSYHEHIKLDSEAYDDFLALSPEFAHRFKQIKLTWSSHNQQHLLLPFCTRFCNVTNLVLILVRWPLTFISRADLVRSLAPLTQLVKLDLTFNPECVEYLGHNANEQLPQQLPQVKIFKIIVNDNLEQPPALATHSLVANAQLARLCPNVQVVILDFLLERVCGQCRAANQFDTRKCCRLTLKAIFDTCPNLKFIESMGNYYYSDEFQNEDDAPVEGGEDDEENSERNEDEDEHDDNIVNADNNNVLVVVEDDGNNTDVSDDSAIADDDDAIADDINADVLVDLLVNNNDHDDDYDQWLINQ